MPRILGQNMSPLGALGSVRGFMSVVREIDFNEVKERAEKSPAVVVIAESNGDAEQVAADVFGEGALRSVETRSAKYSDVDGKRFDVIVVSESRGALRTEDVKKGVGQDFHNKVVTVPMSASGMTPEKVVSLRDAIIHVDIDLAPAFGRTFPELQLSAVKAIVDEVSRTNAQFALVSNAPAVIPIVGGLVSASADLIVLTKNQVMMVFKIAAVHGRDLDNQMAIMRELAPVVGSGFLWRTIAREAASFIPLAAGTVPKVVIAYAGTMVMGRAADYYYRFGKKPTRDQLKAFTAKANDVASRLQLGTRDSDLMESEATAEDADQSAEPAVVN